MKALLDTHAFLWWIGDDPRLSVAARRIIGDGANQVYFSAASAWEIAIKAALGRLSAVAHRDLEQFITEQVGANHFEPLPIQLRHALRTRSLPPHHRDPFDRILVAQAASEELVLLSADPKLRKYRLRVVW